MDKDWQELTAFALVALAVGALLWRALRPEKGRHETVCGCTGHGGARPQGSIILRARKGERLQVIARFK